MTSPALRNVYDVTSVVLICNVSNIKGTNLTQRVYCSISVSLFDRIYLSYPPYLIFVNQKKLETKKKKKIENKKKKKKMETKKKKNWKPKLSGGDEMLSGGNEMFLRVANVTSMPPY